MARKKKSKYKHVIINKKKYYFYTIDWIDITGDAGHASAEEFNKFECATHDYSSLSFLKKLKSLFGRSVVMIRKMRCFLIEMLCLWLVV